MKLALYSYHDPNQKCDWCKSFHRAPIQVATQHVTIADTNYHVGYICDDCILDLRILPGVEIVNPI